MAQDNVVTSGVVEVFTRIMILSAWPQKHLLKPWVWCGNLTWEKRLGRSFIWLFFHLSHKRLNKTDGMIGGASLPLNYTHGFVFPLSDLGRPVRASILMNDDHPITVAGYGGLVWGFDKEKIRLWKTFLIRNCQYIKMHLKVTSGKHIKEANHLIIC